MSSPFSHPRLTFSFTKSSINPPHQVEDLQDALSAAQRAKRSADSELSEVSDRLQSVELAKMEAENRISALQKQVNYNSTPILILKYVVSQVVSLLSWVKVNLLNNYHCNFAP